MKQMFNPKKPFLWILIAVVLVAAVVVCLLLFKPKTEMDAALDECIVSTLLDQHRTDHTNGKYSTATYTALAVREKKDTVTVYGVMMYREYTCTTQDELRIWGNVHCPFAITAKRTADGYALVECWWPDNGADYVPSIKDKFPAACRQKAINAQQFYPAHDTVCKTAAEKEIVAEDKYTVLQSERENAWIAYQEQGEGCYMVSSAFSVEGTYLFTGNSSAEFLFGNRKVVFDFDGNDFVYNAEVSKNVPEDWNTNRNVIYLADGTCFTPVVRGDTAPVGITQTIRSMNWMGDDAITKMFGYVPKDFSFDTVKAPYLPVKLLDSRAQLDQLLAAHMEDEQWPDLVYDNFTQYDEAFFEKNSLVMTYYKAGTCSAEPTIDAFVYTEEGTCLSVRLSVTIPDPHDTALGQWLLFAGIKKKDVEGITVLESYVPSKPSDGAPSADALTFTGKVMEVEGRSILMESYDVGQFIHGVWVELGDLDLNPKVGEEYVVTYADMMMPSLPPRITAVSIKPKEK